MLNRNGLNFNPKAQKFLLSVAVNKGAGLENQVVQLHEGEGGTDENRTNSIPVTNFKSNKLSQIDKKQRAD